MHLDSTQYALVFLVRMYAGAVDPRKLPPLTGMIVGWLVSADYIHETFAQPEFLLLHPLPQVARFRPPKKGKKADTIVCGVICTPPAP